MRLAVFGDPVEHSLSPLLHTTALRHCGISGTYEACVVDEAGMKRAVDDLRTGAIDGANVTMPHKHLAHDLCDRVASGAGRTGAVNTLVRVADEVMGHNTDIGGVRSAWRWARLPDDAPVVVYGAGGAAGAVLVAVEGRQVSVAARRAEAAESLVERIGSGEVAQWGPPSSGSVMVNATPIGMRGDAFPDGWVERTAGVLDMAYGAADTPLVTAARSGAIPVASGQDMLLGQAIDSFWLWTGRHAPVDAMRTALAQR